METAGVYWGYIGITEKKMDTIVIIYDRVYIGIIKASTGYGCCLKMRPFPPPKNAAHNVGTAPDQDVPTVEYPHPTPEA